MRFGGETVTRDIGALPAGTSEQAVFPIPDRCFGSDCFFSITVDAGQAINETNEGNNVSDGRYIG